MKLRELETRDPPGDLPLIAKEDYAYLWISDFWDGPKSGMLLYKGQEYWFELFRENGDDSSLDMWYRKYAVVSLTADQLAKEHEVDEDFRRYVGSHPNLRPKEEHHIFYDKHLDYCRARHYDENSVIAWFEL